MDSFRLKKKGRLFYDLADKRRALLCFLLMWPSPASQLVKQPADFARTAVVQDCAEFF
jgi:hypothetical protein